MKRLLIVLLCLPIAALGQGIRFDSSVMTAAANVPYGAQAPVYTIPFTSVFVCAYPASGNPCTNTVTVYSDQALTQPLDQPLQTDNQGRFGFWAAAGQYTYSAVSPTGKFMGTFIATLSPVTGGGGGSAPAGNLNEVNAKLDSSNFQGSGLYATVDKTLLSTAVPSYSQFARNSPRSNSPCTTFSCAQSFFYAQDAALFDSHNNATGIGAQAALYHTALYTAPGVFNGFNIPSYELGGGSSYKLEYDNVSFHTPGISQTYGGTTYCGKPFDCAYHYEYLRYHGGQWGSSDEGATVIKTGGGNSYLNQGAILLNSTFAAGSTTITGANLGNPDDFLVNGFVYNVNLSPTAVGNVTGYDAVNHLLTVSTISGTITPPTTRGSTTAVIQAPSDGTPATGFPFSATVHVTLGTGYTITQGNPVVFVCDNIMVEFPTITNITPVDGSGNTVIAGTFMHGHPVGCDVVQGGTMGVFDFTADRIGSAWKTSYFAYDATDSTHIHEASYLYGTRGVINASRHNFGGGQNHVTSAVVTRTSNVVKVCNLGQSDYNFGAQYVRLSGFTPSDFNGTYIASQLDANYCFTVANTGGNGTATGGAVDVGGDVNSPDGTILGGGGFNILPTAMLKGLGTTTTTSNGKTQNSYNGTVTFFPNNLSFGSGNYLNVLDDMQGKLEPISAAGVSDTPPNPKQTGWLNAYFSGYGVMGADFRGLAVTNSFPWTNYLGGGSNGTMPGPTLAQLFGPASIDINMTAPLPRGKSIFIGRNPMMNHGVGNQTFFPFFVEGIGGGGGGFTVTYNPDTGTSSIASGNGNGISSGITLAPTTMSLGASAGITLQNLTTFTALVGTGTRYTTVDSTGKIQAGQAVGFTGKCTAPQTPNFVNGIATGCS